MTTDHERLYSARKSENEVVVNEFGHRHVMRDDDCEET